MKPAEVAERLGIAPVTLRVWTHENQFGRWLSPSARGGDGRRRTFTDRDIQILTLIVELKANNADMDSIHSTLQASQSAGWVDLPDIPHAPPGVGPIAMIPREAAESKIDQQRQALYREIALLKEDIEELEQQLSEAVVDRDRYRDQAAEAKADLARAEGRAETLQTVASERDRLQSELQEALTSLGKAQGQLQSLEAIEGQRDKIAKDLRRLLIAAAIIAVIVVVLLVILLIYRQV